MAAVGLTAALVVLAAWIGAKWAANQAVQQAEHAAWVDRQAHAVLESELERLRGSLDATRSVVGEGLLYLDRDQRIVLANGPAREWFQLDPLLPARPTLIAALRSADLRDIVVASLSGDEAPDVVPIGEARFHVQVAPLADGGAVVALLDVTALDRLLRARRDLVANFSHDLRTPLTSLMLLAESLLAGMGKAGKKSAKRPLEAGEQRAVVEQMRDQIATLATLADGLVMLNQIESGRAIFRLQAEALGELVNAAVDGLGPQLEESGVTVQNEIPPAVHVLADRPHVIRLFTNLLDNARRYAPTGGTVRVYTTPSPEPDRVLVHVMDGGPGIPPEDLARIFERFYRGDRARTSSGAGLGLAIARHIVEGHGGTIAAENNTGAGVTLSFTLPAGE